jgi:hypothetical protein
VNVTPFLKSKHSPVGIGLLSAAFFAWNTGSVQAQQAAPAPIVVEHPHADCGIDVRPEDLANGQYGGFYTWPEMVSQMDTWLAKYPNILSCQSLGTTVQGRKIPLLKISDNPNVDENEPEILYVVGIHPREQAPTVAIIRFVNDLLSSYGTDPEITNLINTREIWVVPMLNVDGKIYDMQNGNGTDKGADWRKNRRPNADGTFGVDLNRNFPVRWGGDRSMDEAWKTTTADTRGNIYEGPLPASEPETQAVMDFIRRRPLSIMLDLHSPLHDMRAPGFLSASEQPIFARVLSALQKSQKQPYGIQIGKPGVEPSDTDRSGNTGVSYAWSYYTTGAYSFNIEMAYRVTSETGASRFSTGVKARYADAATVETEYTDNIRGPLMTLLRECGYLKVASKGSAKLLKSSWDGAPKAGNTVTWKPEIDGAFDYAVAVSGNAAGVVKTEFRIAPASKGFPIEIQQNATAGTHIPVSLYVWNRDRQLSVLTTDLVVE